jgi:hypothetical protein
MAIHGQRILDMMAQGMTAQQVFSVVGGNAKDFNELVKSEGFAEAVLEKRKEYLTEANEDEIVSNRYLAVENKLLKSLEDKVDSAEFRDVVRALDVVANRQSKRLDRVSGVVGQGNSLVTINQVSLLLPSHTIPEYVLSPTKEVVAIDGKQMNSMSSEGVKNLFQGIKDKEKLVASF